MFLLEITLTKKKRKKQGNILFPFYGMVNEEKIFTKGNEKVAIVVFKTTISKVKQRESNEPFSMAIRIGQLTWNQRKVVWYGLAVFSKALKRDRLHQENIANVKTFNYPPRLTNRKEISKILET